MFKFKIKINNVYYHSPILFYTKIYLLDGLTKKMFTFFITECNNYSCFTFFINKALLSILE